MEKEEARKELNEKLEQLSISDLKVLMNILEDKANSHIDKCLLEHLENELQTRAGNLLILSMHSHGKG
jgi:hypothetical protein